MEYKVEIVDRIESKAWRELGYSKHLMTVLEDQVEELDRAIE